MKSRIKIPTYNDGILKIYKICQDEDIQASKYLLDTGIKVCYEELSVSDKLRSSLEGNSIDITMKIRIPYISKKYIDSNCVVEIDEKTHKVYNVYSFTDNDGFKKLDITLTNWEDVYEKRKNDRNT